MSPFVFTIILFAALLHATWNAIVKSSSDKLLTTVLITGSASMLAALGLPFLPSPSPASWPFIAASMVLQIGYFSLVAQIYQIADMGQTYPVMRGSAPLLVALASQTLLGERLPVAAWGGITIICAGILGMALTKRGRMEKRGLALAFLSAFFVAGFTLIDALGVRRSGAPASYTLWIFFVTGLPLVAWAMLSRRRSLLAYGRANIFTSLIGGIGTIAAYGLSLWTMTLALVAALRETSILFGTAISALLLKERVSTARAFAACVIVTGAIALRLA